MRGSDGEPVVSPCRSYVVCPTAPEHCWTAEVSFDDVAERLARVSLASNSYRRGKGLSIAAPVKKRADHRLFIVSSFGVASGRHFGDQLGIIWLLLDVDNVGPHRGGDRRG